MQRLIDNNELKVYYDELPALLTDNYLSKEFSILPDHIQDKILKYRSLEERGLRIMGKIVLSELLRAFNLVNEADLTLLKYSGNHKPYINDAIDFSIGHSGKIVICGVSPSVSVGVDVELIKEIDPYDYEDYFCNEELNLLAQSDSRKFYKLWTRKEALSKATGEGILFPFKDISILNEFVSYNNCSYRFIDCSIGNAYEISVCVGERPIIYK